jgi:hypothetical protein
MCKIRIRNGWYSQLAGVSKELGYSKDWSGGVGQGLSGRALVQHVRGPRLNPQYHKNNKGGR